MCKYCEENKDFFEYERNGFEMNINRERSELVISFYGEHDGDTAIIDANFCFVCGRKL